MNKNLAQILQLLKEDQKLFLSISFGVFLFILFFQPFPLERFDFNNRLLIVAGLGGIVLLFLVLVRAISFRIMQYLNRGSNGPAFPSYLGGFIIMALSAVAFAFYLRYVGLVQISFFVMSKVVLICLVPPIVLGIFDEMKELRQQNELLLIEKEIVGKQVVKYEKDYLNQSIEFISDNSTENLSLHVEDIAIIRSSDNYVEIIYNEGGQFRKKLMRNTLRNIEHQLNPFHNFIRCHRTCIVNIHYIEKLNKQYNNHWLTLKDYPEQIPVSRQYLLKLKEAI